MTLEELHARVRAFVDARDWGRYHSPRNLAMALSVEAGELLEVFLWTTDDAPIGPESRARAADEAADVLMCLLNFADRAEIDLGAALESKLARAAAKYPAEQVRGRALKYDAYASWDGAGHRTRHLLGRDAVPRDVPADVRDVLTGRGLPPDVPFDGGRFRSALGAGHLRTRDAGYGVGELSDGETVRGEVLLRIPEGDVVIGTTPLAGSFGAFVDRLDAQTTGRSR